MFSLSHHPPIPAGLPHQVDEITHLISRRRVGSAGYFGSKMLIPRLLEPCYTAPRVCSIWQLLHASFEGLTDGS